LEAPRWLTISVVGVSDIDLLAASLRADAGDIRAFVEALATKLSEAFPGHVLVERRGSRLRGAKRVRRIVLPLADDRFELDHDDGRIVCLRSTMVRGISLRTERLELDNWLDLLSRSLVTEAETSERGRDALQRLLQ
jgi:hypothetical protein